MPTSVNNLSNQYLKGKDRIQAYDLTERIKRLTLGDVQNLDVMRVAVVEGRFSRYVAHHLLTMYETLQKNRFDSTSFKGATISLPAANDITNNLLHYSSYLTVDEMTKAYADGGFTGVQREALERQKRDEAIPTRDQLQRPWSKQSSPQTLAPQSNQTAPAATPVYATSPPPIATPAAVVNYAAPASPVVNVENAGGNTWIASVNGLGTFQLVGSGSLTKQQIQNSLSQQVGQLKSFVSSVAYLPQLSQSNTLISVEFDRNGFGARTTSIELDGVVFNVNIVELIVTGPTDTNTVRTARVPSNTI